MLVILFLVLGTFVRKPYECVLLDRFGHIVEQDQQTRIMYNWYLKLPTDTVIPIDTRIHMDTTPLQEVVTGGGALDQRAGLQQAWRITDPVKFYKTTAGSDTRAKQIMEQKLTGLMKAKIAAHTLDELFNPDDSKIHTDEIEHEVAQEATARFAGPLRPRRPHRRHRRPGPRHRADRPLAASPSRPPTPTPCTPACPPNASSRPTSTAARATATPRGSLPMADRKPQSSVRQHRSRPARSAVMGPAGPLEVLAGVQASPAAREFYEYWKSMEFVKSSLAKNTYLVLPTDADWLRALFNAPAAAPGTQPTAAGAPASAQTSIAK